MYKTILVPLDGSKRAEAIVPHVEQLALKYGAKVVFLQVVQPHGTHSGAEALPAEVYQKAYEQQRLEAQKYLDGMVGTFREKGIAAATHIVSGRIIDQILSAAEREHIDLVAIASHGRTGLARVFYGSIAAGILHRIDRPLLLVRSRNSQ